MIKLQHVQWIHRLNLSQVEAQVRSQQEAVEQIRACKIELTRTTKE